ncbi:hypothetical protein FH972_009125 [Carpinus fangiana]|uniref:WAT1-related protein n=1 Tax=Carpinus fangiana TaxID=176857 RepID=A0A5N6R0W5_9ROSI|nr:hypothetical protein FH972_009125 [Carpinus fangiana]
MGEVVPFMVMVAMEGCTIGLTILAKTAITNGMSPFNRTTTLHLSSPLAILLPGFNRDNNRSEPFIPRPKLQFSNSSLCNGPFAPCFFLHPLSHTQQQLLIFSSEPEHWALGGILLAATSLSVSVWNVIQLETLKQYPEVEVMEVVSFYSLLGTVQCAIVSLMVEKNLSAWKLKLNMELLLIVLTGSFYVPMFKPFGILFATIFGISFFTNSLHYGSVFTEKRLQGPPVSSSLGVIGAIIIGIGYYGVMWGQITEDEVAEDDGAETVDSLEKKIPLLQDEMQV